VHEHMPELLQVLEHLGAASPISPRVRVVVERCLSGSNHRRIYVPILAGDPPSEAGHRRSTKIVWNLCHGQLKSAMPTQRESVSRSDLTQGVSGACGRKRRVRDQQLDVRL
jgi:hypothetical protein